VGWRCDSGHRTGGPSPTAHSWRLRIELSCSSFAQAAGAVKTGAFGAALPNLADEWEWRQHDCECASANDCGFGHLLRTMQVARGIPGLEPRLAVVGASRRMKGSSVSQFIALVDVARQMVRRCLRVRLVNIAEGKSGPAGTRLQAETLREWPKGEPFRAIDTSREFQGVSLAESFGVYHPSFNELFDRPKAERLESLTVEILVSPDEARFGCRVRVKILARVTCSVCGGQGAVGSYECWRCEGHGSLTTEYPGEGAYPAGVRDGYAVRIPLTCFGIKNFYLIMLLRVSGGRQ
jgi:hypothetical protein